MINDEEAKAKIFNNHFSSVFTVDNGTPTQNFTTSNVTIENVSFEMTDVFELLKNLGSKKFVGPDGFSPFLLKKLALELTFPLHLIFKKSLELGKIPVIWKTAHVVPIFKKVEKTQAKNYRPKSLTCRPCRILEKIIHKNISSFLSINNLITPAQHGFRPNKSTETQLLSSLNSWTQSLDQKNSNVDVSI